MPPVTRNHNETERVGLFGTLDIVWVVYILWQDLGRAAWQPLLGSSYLYCFHTGFVVLSVALACQALTAFSHQ